MDTRAFMSFIEPVPNNPNKVNAIACAQCGEGNVYCCETLTRCCESLPCYLSPDDIKDKSFESLCELIDTGLVSLDWWVGDPKNSSEEENKSSFKGFFLRARAKNAPIVHPAIFHWPCIFYNKDIGCELSFSYRPKGGRELLPPFCKDNPHSYCEPMYDKKGCVIDWLPYHDTLTRIYDKYKSDINDPTINDDARTELFLSSFVDTISDICDS